MFPQGGPGIALFLLRTSVAVIFFMNAAKLVSGSSVQLVFAGIALMSIALAIGFLTPYLSVMAYLSAAAHLVIGSSSSNLVYVFEICNAAALALLGPGAYSVDAKLFGRRVTVVHPRKDKPSGIRQRES